jgi:hypothetical protein
MLSYTENHLSGKSQGSLQYLQFGHVISSAYILCSSVNPQLPQVTMLTLSSLLIAFTKHSCSSTNKFVFIVCFCLGSASLPVRTQKKGETD